MVDQTVGILEQYELEVLEVRKPSFSLDGVDVYVTICTYQN